MKNYIYLRAYLNENLGDDLFVEIIANRYSDYNFRIYDVPSKMVEFPKNVEFILDEDKANKICKQRTKFDKIRSNRIMRHLLIDFFLQDNCEKRRIIRNSILRLYVIGSGFMEGGKIGLEYYLNEKNFFKKDAYLLGCNFGPYHSEQYKKIHERLFALAKDICFRDTYSRNQFFMLPNVRQEADIVFTYNGGEKNILGVSLGYILISVVNLNKDTNNGNLRSDYLEFLIKLILDIIKSGKKVILVGFCKNQRDNEVIEKVCDVLLSEQLKNIQTFNYPDIGYKEMMWLFKNADAVVASRYHAAIIGMLYSKKIYVLAYSEKIIHVLQDIDQSIRYIDVREKVIVSPEDFLKNYGYNISDKRLKKIKNSAELQFIELDKKLLKKRRGDRENENREN